jgi:hypothetical protein
VRKLLANLARALLTAALFAASVASCLAQTPVVPGSTSVAGKGAAQAFTPYSASNPLSTANPIGITPTDHTITSASGSSQQVMPANSSRHSLTIVNTGNANCGVNPTGGTAVIGGAGTFTLVPNGSYTPRVPTLSAVTVICTSGQPIYADDN